MQAGALYLELTDIDVLLGMACFAPLLSQLQLVSKFAQLVDVYLGDVALAVTTAQSTIRRLYLGSEAFTGEAG